MCNFCGKIGTGSAARRRQHILALGGEGLPTRKGVKGCTETMKHIPQHIRGSVQEEERKSVEGSVALGVTRVPRGENLQALLHRQANNAAELRACTRSNALPEALKKSDSSHVDKAWADWYISSNIPFRASNPAFQEAMDATCAHVLHTKQAYKPPGRKRLAGPLLHDAYKREHVDRGCNEIARKVQWTGYSFSSDGLTDRKGVPLLNFCIATSGTESLTDLQIFHQPEEKNSEFILESLKNGFKRTVEALAKGSDNTGGTLSQEQAAKLCVQVITDGAANCAKARKQFAQEHPWMFEAWCALHCIGLFFKDVFNIAHYKDIYQKAHDCIKYIKVHDNLRLAFDNARNSEGTPTAPALELPGHTRMGGKWSLLRRAIKSKDKLRAVFTTPFVTQWSARLHGAEKQEFGKFRELVNQEDFWGHIEKTVSLLQPAFIVMKVADGTSDAMSWMKGLSLRVYWHFDAAVEEAKQKRWVSRGRLEEVQNLWQKRWDDFHNPLHTLAYALNPAFANDKVLASGNMDAEIRRECREALKKFCLEDGGDENEEDGLTNAGKTKLGNLFGELVAYNRGELGDGVSWVTLKAMQPTAVLHYLPSFEHLPLVANIVLAQPVSVSGCERVWSNLAWIQGKLRGRLLPETGKKLLCTCLSLRTKKRRKINVPHEKVLHFMDEEYDIPEWWLGKVESGEEDDSHIFSSDVAEAERTVAGASDGGCTMDEGVGDG